MAQRKNSVPCPCGKQAEQVITGLPAAFVMGKQYEYRRECLVDNFSGGARSNQEQQDGYSQQMAAARASKMAHKRAGSRHKTQAQYLGSMPMEAVHSIGLQEGDPEIVFKDPAHFLKANNLYLGDE